MIALVAAGHPPAAVLAPCALVAVLLAARLLLVRPRLTKRSDRVLAGENLPPSRTRLCSVGLEVLKVAALVSPGISPPTS